MNITRSYLKDLVYQVNGAAIEVHKSIGPGLLESVYHQCLKKELELRKINYSSELLVPLKYKGHELESKLRCDLLIENNLVVELKSVNEINPIFEAQLLTYMNLLNAPIGLLINFNVKNIFYEGQKTFVNEFYSRLED
ncbi:GxxExxY protein [Flavobacterium granuli]|uniref:GxxExxY protein n=1 Tax=Flavobacterium granuli TaxID=280093 RepID=A0A1M5KIS6_9FLAO|nr:GxxExxY protein [Flavobacterium granuli]PRZ26311.1 GxxExxY protein [Flavobacterium granuli]SHG52677.1 GxxExxY protein [Flavobacterium granuli]